MGQRRRVRREGEPDQTRCGRTPSGDVQPQGAGVRRLGDATRPSYGWGCPAPCAAWWSDLPLNLAALANGGRITACSNMFSSSPNNLLLPGAARSMGEGWETSRRRDAGNDWVQVCSAGECLLSAAELDTSYFIGNAPGSARLSGRN